MSEDHLKELREIAFRQQEIAGTLIRITEELKEIKEAIISAVDEIRSAAGRSQPTK
jgi:hypothetical protein